MPISLSMEAAKRASVIAGLLWDRVGPAATFGAGALFAALAAVLLVALLPAARERADRHAHAG